MLLFSQCIFNIFHLSWPLILGQIYSYGIKQPWYLQTAWPAVAINFVLLISMLHQDLWTISILLRVLAIKGVCRSYYSFSFSHFYPYRGKGRQCEWHWTWPKASSAGGLRRAHIHLPAAADLTVNQERRHFSSARLSFIVYRILSISHSFLHIA